MRRILVVLAVLVACSPLAPASRADAAAGTACTTGYSNKLAYAASTAPRYPAGAFV